MRSKALARFAALSALTLATALVVQGAASGYWYLYARKWVFCPGETATVGLSVHQERTIALELYKLDPRAFDTPNWPAQVRAVGKRVPGELLKRWSVEVPAKGRKGHHSWDVQLPTEGLGAYVAVAKAGRIERRAVIIVTDVAVVAKQTGTKLTAWVTDIVSGKPVPDRTVRVRPAQRWGAESEVDGSAWAEAATDADGLAKFDLPAPGTKLVSVRSGDSVAYCYTYSEMHSQTERVYLYTERPVYRPKQSVHFKGVARRDHGHEWETLADQDVGLLITDPDGEEILSETYTTNEYGSFAGELELSAAPLHGSYSMRASVGDANSYARFYVEEYRKPEFRVRAKTPQNVYFPGDKVEFSVEASYYFGAPVADAHVKYYVYSGYYWAPYESADEYSEEFEEAESDEWDEGERYYGYGELLYEGEAATGPDGIAKVIVDAKQHDTTRRYTIDARVTDQSRREVRGSGSCAVAPSQIRPRVSVGSWITKPGEKITISLETTDVLAESGVSWKAEVTIRRAWWEKTLKGSSERWQQHFEDVSTHTVETDADGRGSLELRVPEPDGHYQALVTVRDRESRKATAATWFRVAAVGRRSSWIERETLRIQADKARYEPGETARVVVTGRNPDAYVLVTVEGYDLFECWVKRLTGYSAYFEIPIKEEYKPNVYFKACSVREMTFAEDPASVRVSPAGKFLSVEVSADKEVYGPGDLAAYTVSIADQQGQPVSAEVSLGVVDEAIYAIRRDATPDVRRFFYANRRNTVSTSHSFAQQYWGGADKEEPEEPKEGEVVVRRRFEDTAYWNPFIVTDGSGSASVSFELPDNLTTWRATAIAATPETEVGQARQRQLVTKPLVARLVTPRFLTQGDTAAISGIVHNYTGEAQDVSVSLEAEGATLLGTGAKQSVTIEPEGQKRFEWAARAGTPGEATFTLKAVGTDASDAMALSLRVNPFGVRQSEVYSGRAASETSRIFMLPPDAVEDTAKMHVSLSPSLAGTVLESLKGLARYPYGCIEQTMSGFLPDVLLARAMRDLGLSDEWLDANLDDMVQVGFRKLYTHQQEGGGWGWSAHDDVDLYWTNYVVYGLLMADQAGFDVSTERLDRGLSALRGAASEADKAQKAEVLHTLSIAEGKAWHKNAARALGALQSEIRASGGRSANELDGSLAFLALAFANMADMQNARECCRLLGERATTTVDTASWGSKARRRCYYGTQNTETTAWALRALLAGDPKSPLIPKAVNWLMRQRTDRGWRSTKDTCAVLMAMIDHLSRTSELEASYTARVRVNGQEIAQLSFTGDDMFKPETRIDVDPDLLRRGANVVTVSKDGEGTLYWTGVLDFYLPGEKARPAGAGLRIEKLYLKAEAVRKKGRWGTEWDWNYSSAKDGVEPGDLVYCKLVIRADEPYEYVLIADPIPAGCEFHKDEYEYRYRWWDWWYGQREYHDDHIAFLSSSLEEGKNVITYYLRAETPGEFHVSPGDVSQMYVPSIRGNSQAMTLKIRE